MRGDEIQSGSRFGYVTATLLLERVMRIVPLLLFTATGSAAADPPLRVVARTGDPGLSAGADAEFQYFQNPQLDALGRATFVAFLQGPLESGGPMGIWAERDAGVVEVARQGLPVLDLPGVGYGSLGNQTFDWLVVDGAGNALFRAQLDSAASPTGVFQIGAAAVAAIALEGEHPDQTPVGVVYDAFQLLALNAGIPAFQAPVSGTGVTTSNDSGIFVGPNATLLMREGEVAPGALVPFGRAAAVRINAAGEVAFEALQALSSQPFGIWAEGAAGDLEAIAFEGGPAPGLPGVTFIAPARSSGTPRGS